MDISWVRADLEDPINTTSSAKKMEEMLVHPRSIPKPDFSEVIDEDGKEKRTEVAA